MKENKPSYSKIFTFSQGEQDPSEFAANTDANHTCRWQIFFFLMLMKEYVLVLKNFLLLHNLNKENDLTAASY